MDVLRTEEEQLEALREWWKENGKSALLGVALGLAAIFGWRAWQAHELTEAETASALYQELAGAVRGADVDKAGRLAGDLQQRYPDSAYAVFSGLIQAKLAIDAGDLDAAAGHLRTALARNTDPALKNEIRLRLARVLASQDKHDEALALLDGETGAYAAEFDELRGDLETGRGNLEAARTAYERAMSQARAAGADTGALEVKLSILGPKPAA